MKKTRSFIRKETSFFFCFHSLLYSLFHWHFGVNPLLSQRSFQKTSLVLFLFSKYCAIYRFGRDLFFFHYSPLPLLFSADKEKRIELLVAVAFTLGFANLLFGFITSFIGQLLFFVIGLLIQAIHEIAQKKRPQFSPRVLLLAITFFCATSHSLYSSLPIEPLLLVHLVCLYGYSLFLFSFPSIHLQRKPFSTLVVLL